MFTPFDAEPALAAIAEEPAGPSDERQDVITPSRKGEAVSGPGSIWDTAGASSARSKASNPAAHQAEPGSIWGTEGTPIRPAQGVAARPAHGRAVPARSPR